MTFREIFAKRTGRKLLTASVISLLLASNLAAAKATHQEVESHHGERPELVFVFFQSDNRGFGGESWNTSGIFKSVFLLDTQWSGASESIGNHRNHGMSGVVFVQPVSEHRGSWYQGFASNHFDTANMFRWFDEGRSFHHDEKKYGHDAWEEASSFLDHDKHHQDYFRESPGDFCNTPVPAPVPEPSSIALLLAGLGVIGVIAKRRKHEWPEDQY